WWRADGPNRQRLHRVVDRYLLGGADAFQQRSHGPRGQQPERVVMRARPDGRQHLLRLRRGEYEDQMIRWLLDDLQQRVEACRGDHVRLVDDEDPVARLCGRIERSVPQLAGVIHTAVAGRVEFDDVDTAGTVRGQRDARVTDSTGCGRWALLAVQRAGEDARRRRLPAAPRSGEQVGVVDAACSQGRLELFGDMLLPDYFSERCRPVLAVERHAQQATENDRRPNTSALEQRLGRR